MRSFVVLGCCALVSGGAAHALEQAKHRAISQQYCAASGLPQKFCARVGNEAYNVDSNEWNDLAAHAQPDNGQAPCDAANRAIERERRLGSEIRNGIAALVDSSAPALAGDVAKALGRALHTVQDNCAHNGMPNPQHAWHSLSDSCRATQESPDVQPDAFDCANQETETVFASFISALAQAGVAGDALAGAPEEDAEWPTRGSVCQFLLEAANWDGQDRRWNNAQVRPALTNQLVHAVTTDDEWLGDVCGGDPNGIALPEPLAPFDTTSDSLARHWCVKLNTFCVGHWNDKADSVDRAAPPWTTDAESGAPTAAAGVDGGGCSMAANGSGARASVVWTVAFAFMLLFRRRGARSPAGRQ